MPLVQSLLDMLVALLPAEERLRVSSRLGLDPVRGTTILLPIQILGAGALWVFGLIGFAQASLAGAHSDAAPAALWVLIYATSPRGAGLGYVFVTGVVRGLHFAANAAPLADPLLALALALFGGVQRKARREARLAELGPDRPDRIVADRDEIVVIAAREKPEWTSRTTIEIGQRFYQVRSVEDQADGARRAVAYHLSPVAASAIFRVLVHYDPPRTSDQRRTKPETATPAEPFSGPAPRPMPPAAPRAPAAHQRWRVEAGEEARLTPEGPGAAVIESLGSLPLRPRSAPAARHRAAFPGTCLVLGGERFEVVEEHPLETGFQYRLEPWAPEFVIRDTLEYGPALVRAAQRERQRAVFSEGAASYSWLFVPLFGLLPESRQIQACSRYNLDPKTATLAGATLEGIATLLALAALNRASPALAFTAISPLALVFLGPALARGFAVLAWGEVGGSALLGAAANLAREWTETPRRFDPMVLPVTREAFWARLSLPDRQKRQPDGSVVVHSVLPHLSWGVPRLQVGGDYWSVSPLPATLQNGRLTYGYELQPEARAEAGDEGVASSRPPGPRHYQEEVAEVVAGQWEEVFGSAPWLPCLLPRIVQERAHRPRGGVAAARGWTVITSAAEAGLAVWFVTGPGFFNVVTGLLFGYDAGRRLWRTLNDEYAPCLFGWIIADYLLPERAAYRAHREAERSALLALRTAR